MALRRYGKPEIFNTDQGSPSSLRHISQHVTQIFPKVFNWPVQLVKRGCICFALTTKCVEHLITWWNHWRLQMFAAHPNRNVKRKRNSTCWCVCIFQYAQCKYLTGNHWIFSNMLHAKT